MRRTHYLRNASAGLFLVLLVVAAQMFAHNSMQSCGVKLQQVSCTTGPDPSACYYSFSLDVTNNSNFTGQATLSGTGLFNYTSPFFHPGSGNIVTGTLQVPCGTTGVLLTVSLPGTSCTVQVLLPKCSCNVQATATDQTICKSASTQISLPSTPSGNINWYFSSPCASPIPSSGIVPTGWSALGITTAMSTVTPLLTTCYQAVVTNMLNCPTGTGVSNLVTVNVVNPSSPGSIGCTVGGSPCPANGEFCDGSAVVLNDPNTPGPNCSRQWYQWIGSIWQPIPGGVMATATLTSPTCPFEPAKFRVVYSCPHCPDNFSEISFKVYSKSVGGTITGGPPICDGMGDVLTLAGECGDILNWESSSDGINFNAINGSGGAHTWFTNGNPPNGPYYRAVIRNGPNGPCPIAHSNVFQVTLNHKPNPIVTPPGPLAFCAGNSQILTATNPNGGTCQWYHNGLPTGATGMTYSASASGNYYVVCSNSCGTTKSNLIKVKASKPVAAILGACGVCLGNCVTLKALVKGGVPAYHLHWSPTVQPNQFSQTVTACPTTTTTYTVQVLDAINCVATASHTVTICKKKVVASAGPNVTTCPGGQVTIGGSPTASFGSGSYSYSWSPAVGLSSSSIANPTASPSHTMSYTVTVTDSTNCKSTATVIVTVQGPPCAKPRAETLSSLSLFFGLGSQLDLTNEIPWRTMRFVPSANFAAQR